MAKIRVTPKTDDASTARGALVHLSELPRYMIADPSPDIHDWTVRLRDGRTAGKVSDLVVDTDDLVVKYLEVKLTREFRLAEEEEWLLIPASAIRLDASKSDIIVDRLPQAGLSQVPRIRRGSDARRALQVGDAVATAELFESAEPESNSIIEEVAGERPLQWPTSRE